MLWLCQTKFLTIASFGHFIALVFEMYLSIEALSLWAYIRLTRHDLSVFEMTCYLAMPVTYLPCWRTPRVWGCADLHSPPRAELTCIDIVDLFLDVGLNIDVGGVLGWLLVVVLFAPIRGGSLGICFVCWMMLRHCTVALVYSNHPRAAAASSYLAIIFGRIASSVPWFLRSTVEPMQHPHW